MEKTSRGSNGVRRRFLVVAFLSFASILAILGMAVASRFPLFAPQGREFKVNPERTLLGEVVASSTRTVAFELVNQSSKSIRIVGSRRSCSCVDVVDLPRLIPANKSVTVKCVFSAPSGIDAQTEVEYFVEIFGEGIGWLPPHAVTATLVPDHLGPDAALEPLPAESRHDDS